MPDQSFVHLHTHSEFSLLDGAARLDKLVAAAANLGMPALALTDHGSMYGAADFYLKCKKAGIKPIIGVETYVAPQGHRDKTPKPGKNHYHLLLLAQNDAGYQNLLKLTTTAFVDGFYSKPRIDHELLAQHNEGIICTSACLSGELCSYILEGDPEKALRTAAFYRDLFGPERYFIEIQDQGLGDQVRCNTELIRIARELGLRLVCTNDVHYIQREDSYAHDVLLCIGTGSNIGDPNRLKYDAHEFYLKSPDEMRALFPELPEAAENTLAIAEMCNVALPIGDAKRAQLPVPETPNGMSALDYLRELAFDGCMRKLGEISETYRERLEYELSVIEQTGFAPYFLIVRDFALFARRTGIFFGVRGSAAGSLVSYCIDITDIDPVDYVLTFERFLNPERIQMPDIDMDFEDARRSEVIEYVTGKYGVGHVAQIVTFGTLAARAAIKDTGRALAMPLPDVTKVIGMVPTMPLHITIEKAIEDVQELKSIRDHDSDVRNLLDTAQRLEGLSRHSSVHAAGVVISDEPLVEYTPLQRSAEGGLITQYPAGVLEQLGLLKMDFLGLINLTILGRAVENIRKSTGEKMDVRKIPLDDAKAFELLGRGDTTGIFQLESDGMRRNITQLKPTSVRDLAAMVALYRPGPMAHIETFIKAKHGQIEIKYPHKLLEPILSETYGVIVYQDQVMMIARAIAGYTLGQADILRRAMGKKKKEEMAAQRARFMEGAAKTGVSEKDANMIFDLIEPFAGYAFNKAHAVCYAVVAYQTAYLKAHYPVEYMAALLASYIEKTDKIASCLDECRRMGIQLLPPDVNLSGIDFTPNGSAIRFGLAAIKNVGRAAVELVLAAREERGAFTSLLDFCSRCQEKGNVNRATIEALIQSGAFDAIEPNRHALIQVLDQALQAAAKSSRDRRAGQESMFGDDDDDAPLTQIQLPDVADFPQDRKLAFEKELLGFYISGHPLDRYRDRLAKVARDSLADLGGKNDGDELIVGGIITQLTERLSKQNNEKWAKFTLEDPDGHTIDVLAFPAVYRQCGQGITKEAVVVVRGRLKVAESLRDDDEGERLLEVRADDVKPIGSGVSANANGSSTPSALCIYLDDSKTERSILRHVRTVLEQKPGTAAVRLVIREGRAEYRKRATFTVDPTDEVRREVQRITGQQVLIES